METAHLRIRPRPWERHPPADPPAQRFSTTTATAYPTSPCFHYVEFHPRPCCSPRGSKDYCGPPSPFEGSVTQLYRNMRYPNLGNGKIQRRVGRKPPPDQPAAYRPIEAGRPCVSAKTASHTGWPATPPTASPAPAWAMRTGPLCRWRRSRGGHQHSHACGGCAQAPGQTCPATR